MKKSGALPLTIQRDSEIWQAKDTWCMAPWLAEDAVKWSSLVLVAVGQAQKLS
jgi:hypothetical protein